MVAKRRATRRRTTKLHPLIGSGFFGSLLGSAIGARMGR